MIGNDRELDKLFGGKGRDRYWLNGGPISPQLIVTPAANQMIVAGTAVDHVIAISSVQLVVPSTTTEDIVAITSK